MVEAKAQTWLERATEGQLTRWKDEVFETPIPTPRVVDWEVTGTCPYRCEWCWGPDHDVGVKDSMSAKEIQRAMELIGLGTMADQRFVITGGEPMTRSDIAGIIAASVLVADETVLSTTGDRLAEFGRSEKVWDVLALAGDHATIALPLHAASTLVSKTVMPPIRNTAPDRARIVASVFGAAQKLGVGTTLRTTVTSKQRAADIMQIPGVLADLGVDLAGVRWKLYEYDPFVGPRAHSVVQLEYGVESEVFTELVDEVRAGFSDTFAAVDDHPCASSQENYVIIGPDGYIRVVEADIKGKPQERYLRDWKHGELVNIRHDPIAALDVVTEHMPASLWDQDLMDPDDQPLRVRR